MFFHKGVAKTKPSNILHLKIKKRITKRLKNNKHMIYISILDAKR